MPRVYSHWIWSETQQKKSFSLDPPDSPPVPFFLCVRWCHLPSIVPKVQQINNTSTWMITCVPPGPYHQSTQQIQAKKKTNSEGVSLRWNQTGIRIRAEFLQIERFPKQTEHPRLQSGAESVFLPCCRHRASRTWPHYGRSEFTHCKNGSCSIPQLLSRPKVGGPLRHWCLVCWTLPLFTPSLVSCITEGHLTCLYLASVVPWTVQTCGKMTVAHIKTPMIHPGRDKRGTLWGRACLQLQRNVWEKMRKE